MDLYNLTEHDIGKHVKYQDTIQFENEKGEIEIIFLREEIGYITSFNDRYVFVCFDGTDRGQACLRDDLVEHFLSTSKEVTFAL